MNKLEKAVVKMDLSVIELAQAVAKIVKEDYGSHNFKAFKSIINQQLKEVKSENESKEDRLEELYELQGAIKSKKIKIVYKDRVLQTEIDVLEFELGLNKMPF